MQFQLCGLQVLLSLKTPDWLQQAQHEMALCMDNTQPLCDLQPIPGVTDNMVQLGKCYLVVIFLQRLTCAYGCLQTWRFLHWQDWPVTRQQTSKSCIKLLPLDLRHHLKLRLARHFQNLRKRLHNTSERYAITILLRALR
jgi:Domain of unknown function (DUF1866)